MIVPVPVVLNVAMAVVDVVHVVAVRHGHMPASEPMLVVMTGVRGVIVRFAFVDVILVDLVQVAVVDVVDVVLVRHGHVPASQPVLVFVIGVLAMFGGNAHVSPLVGHATSERQQIQRAPRGTLRLRLEEVPGAPKCLLERKSLQT
jgi:hypothetical protein